MEKPTETYLTPTEVAERFRVEPQTIYQMLQSGKFSYIRIGVGKRSPIRVLASSVDDYERKNLRPATGTKEDKIVEAYHNMTPDEIDAKIKALCRPRKRKS